MASQRDLLLLEIEETEAKLARAKKKLRRTEKSLEEAVKASDQLRMEKIRQALRGRRARVKKLSDRLEELKTHHSNGTIPKVIFGGRALWRKVSRGKATKEEWRSARRNSFYARGDKTKGGNPNIKLSWTNGEFFLAVTVSHLSEQKGLDSKGRPLMTRAPKVTGKLWLPEKHRAKALELLLLGTPYTVELTKGRDGRYRAHITFAMALPEPVTDPDRGYLGMDANPDGVALANVGRSGQPEPWPEGFDVPYPKGMHKFAGEFQVTVHPNGFLYIKMPELAYSRGNRRTYLTGVLAQAVVSIAKTLGKPLAVENLNFSKDQLETDKKFNRVAANFPYRKVTEAVMRRAFKEGVDKAGMAGSHLDHRLLEVHAAVRPDRSPRGGSGDNPEGGRS